MWGESERPAILPKTKGSGIMVSDFVKEYGGYLKLSPEELDHAKSQYPYIEPAARRLLEYGAEKEGYWTSDRFMEQKRKGIGLAIASWSRSGMQQILQMSNTGPRTPLCDSLTKAAATKSLMNSLSNQANSCKGWGSPESEGHCLGGETTVHGERRWIGERPSHHST